MHAIRSCMKVEQRPRVARWFEIFSRTFCVSKRYGGGILSYFHGRPLEGRNRHSPPWNWTKNKKNLENLKPGSWFRLSVLIRATTFHLPFVTRTLHKSQLHCSGVMQWWACSSLMPTLASADSNVTKRASALFCYCSLLRNHNMATIFSKKLSFFCWRTEFDRLGIFRYLYRYWSLSANISITEIINA